MIRFEDAPASTLPSEIVRRSVENIGSGTGTIVRLSPDVVSERLAELDMTPSNLFWNYHAPRTKVLDGFFNTFNMNLCRHCETLVEFTNNRAVLHHARRLYAPIYLDHARFVFYYRATPVLECTVIHTIMIEFARTYFPITISRYVFYRKNIVGDAAAVRFVVSEPQRPLPFYSGRDCPHCPVYSYDMLGCEEIDAVSALVYANNANFDPNSCLTFSQTGAVFSDCVKYYHADVEDYQHRQPSFGRNGLLFGAKLPKDEHGRYVVILPAGPNLTLPAKNVRLFAEGMRRLYQAIAGSEPVWLTPAGPKSFDELVFPEPRGEPCEECSP